MKSRSMKRQKMNCRSHDQTRDGPVGIRGSLIMATSVYCLLFLSITYHYRLTEGIVIQSSASFNDQNASSGSFNLVSFNLRPLALPRKPHDSPSLLILSMLSISRLSTTLQILAFILLVATSHFLVIHRFTLKILSDANKTVDELKGFPRRFEGFPFRPH